MIDILDQYVQALDGLIAAHGYPLLIVSMMMECIPVIGLVFPGLTILTLSGYYAGIGVLDVRIVCLCSILGITVSDTVSYFVGRMVVTRSERARRATMRLVGRSEMLQNRSLGYLLFIFHFAPYSRSVVPVALGMRQYRFRRWLVVDFTSAALFSLVMIVVGYFVGMQSHPAEQATSLTTRIQSLFAIAFVIWCAPVLIRFVIEWIRRRRNGIAG